MVRALIIAAALAALGSPATAQTVDWRNAGGDLFGAAREVEIPDAHTSEGDPVRLIELDQPFQQAIDAAARAHGLDPKLLHALVVTESGYRSDAVSPAGAAGLTQLMPGTALDLNVRNRFDPIENLRGGADYLARQILRFQDLRLALAAYNSGPGRVARLGRVPEIAETQSYVSSVINCFLALTAGQAVRSARDCRAQEAGS